MGLTPREQELLVLIADRLRGHEMTYETFGVQALNPDSQTDIGIRIYVDGLNVCTFFRNFVQSAPDLGALAKIAQDRARIDIMGHDV